MAFKERKMFQEKFERPGQEVTGHLLRMRQVQMENGRAVEYRLRDKDGDFRDFLGTSRINRMIEPSDVGCLVRVRYEGDEETKSGQKMKIFRVWIDPENRVGRAAQQPAEPEDPFHITEDDVPF